MKDKKVLILLLLVILVLFLGIGYATLDNKNLIISGNATAEVAEENYVVRFKKSGSSYVEPTGLKNATATVTNDTTATIDVTGLKTVGDTATATYTVENASNGIDANVKAVTQSTGNDEYFKVTTTGLTSTETKVESGDSKEVTVTVELLKTPVEEQTGSITVNLTASAVAK